MSRKKKIFLLVLGLSVIAVCVSQIHISVRAGYKDEEKAATVKAIAQFHSRLNSGQFGEICDEADDVLQNSRTRENLLQAMQETRNHFGKFNRVDFYKLNVVIGPQIQIRAVYNTNYDRGKATELFTFIDRSGVVKLADYQVFAGAIMPSKPYQN